MYYNPAGITGNNLYPWQYTLLDAGNKESVLYAGFVNADQLLACTDGTNYVNSDSAVLQSWVTPPQYTKQSLYIAPVEFYANGLMSWKVDANNQWQRSYKVLDHLGNVRVEGIGWANEFRSDYRPFGGTEWTNSNINSKTSYRLGFLGLQKDKESNLGDHGVRKYDSEIGRFLAIDPLWEKYNTLNPYQYSANSPVMMADWNGMETYAKKLDNGTYEIKGGVVNNNRDIYEVDETGFTGNLIGRSLTTHSFIKDDNQFAIGAIINPYNNSGKDFLNNEVLGKEFNMIEYYWNARSTQHFDFKHRGYNNKIDKDLYYYRGMPFENIKYFGDLDKGVITFASARDIGNIAAGFEAGFEGIAWSTTRLMFDSYQFYKHGTYPEGKTTQAAEWYGWKFGIKEWKYNIYGK